MMKLIIEKSLQIKQMEAYMDKMVQEKENAPKSVSTTMEDLPLAIVPTATPATAATGTRIST